MKKFKKYLTISLAVIMSISAICVNAGASKTYGTVDSLDELYCPVDTLEIDENGEFIINTNEEVEPYGLIGPPSIIAGASDVYVYSGTGNSSIVNNYYYNMDANFSYTFNSSADTTTAQYAEFLIAASSQYKNIYFKATGSENRNLNISLVPMNSNGTLLGPEILPAKASNPETISFYGLDPGGIYAIKITPTQSGAMTGTVYVSGNPS